MAITNTTVSQTYPRFQSLVYPTVTPHAKTLTTAGGAQTLTAAELLGGLLLINCDDAQTLNLPSAADLNAAIPGVAEGTAFEFSVINHGDATLTIAAGTGGTAFPGTVLTIAANASKRFLVRVTGVASQTVEGSSDSYTLYGFGSVSAATA